MTLPLAPWLSELTRRIRVEDLYPGFRDRYLELLVACHERRFDYYAISGHRSWTEQEALYAKGRVRLTDGTWTVGDATKVVTKAPAGSSAHQYGIAADSCLDKDATRAGLQPGWNLGDYTILAEEATKLDLEAAYYWKSFQEGPHVQLPLLSRGITIAELAGLHQKGGQPAVWDRLDSVGIW